MSVLEIRTFPDPILKQKAKRVSRIDSSIRKLAADMIETMHAAPGRVGLAAPQVGIPLRLMVIGIPEDPDIVLVNPVIVKKKGERLLDEGCLSVPGFYGDVKRAESVTVRGRDLDDKEVRIKADGLLAQAIEHEVDHLDGRLYLDHLEDPDKLHKVEPQPAE